MTIIFYISSIITIFATVKTITNTNPIYALLYLLLSIISLASIFFILGSYFAGSISIIIYGGAIMVLFLFVIMILNINSLTIKQTKHIWLKKINWITPAITLISLFGIIAHKIFLTKNIYFFITKSNIKQISIDLFSNYILAIELCSLLLLSGLIIIIIHNKN